MCSAPWYSKTRRRSLMRESSDHVAEEDRGAHDALDDPEQRRGVQLALDQAGQAERQQEEQADREHHRHDHRARPTRRRRFPGLFVGLALWQLRVGGDAERLEADRERPAERDDPAQDGRRSQRWRASAEVSGKVVTSISPSCSSCPRSSSRLSSPSRANATSQRVRDIVRLAGSVVRAGRRRVPSVPRSRDPSLHALAALRVAGASGLRTATAQWRTPRIITPSSTACPPSGASRLRCQLAVGKLTYGARGAAGLAAASRCAVVVACRLLACTLPPATGREDIVLLGTCLRLSAACLRAALTSLGDPALEALDASTCVHELLPSGVERVAVGAHLDVDLLLRGARGEFVAARAAHVRLDVVWVDRSLHASNAF